MYYFTKSDITKVDYTSMFFLRRQKENFKKKSKTKGDEYKIVGEEGRLRRVFAKILIILYTN